MPEHAPAATALPPEQRAPAPDNPERINGTALASEPFPAPGLSPPQPIAVPPSENLDRGAAAGSFTVSDAPPETPGEVVARLASLPKIEYRPGARGRGDKAQSAPLDA